MFSVYGSMILSLGIGIAAALYYQIRDPFLLAMVIGIAPFSCGKILTCFFFMQGQANFDLTNPARLNMLLRGPSARFRYRFNLMVISTFKMPLRHLFILSIIIVWTVFVMYMAFVDLEEEAGVIKQSTIQIIRALVLAYSCGVLIAFLHWIFFWSDYFFGSEYDARVQLKSKGYNDEEIDRRVKLLREIGVFGPPPVTKRK